MRKTILLAALGAAAVAPAGALAHDGNGDSGSNGGSSEIAGTVASFSGGVLTLTKADGTTVSGTVTPRTKIRCAPTTPATTARAARHGDDDGAADDNGTDVAGSDASDDNGTAGTSTGTATTETGHRGDRGRHGGSTCDTTALTPGATVRKAQTRTSSTGAVVFREVKLTK